jgi:hypothetical protein
VTEALAAALAGCLGAPVRIDRRAPDPYASSFPLERLEIVSGDESLSLVWKDLTPAALLPGARLARGRVASDPASELRAYDLLAACELGTPRRVGAHRDGQRAWLFLEAVGGTRLDEVGEVEAWERVARWLPRAHRALAAAAGPDPSWPPAWRPPPGEGLPGDLAGPVAAAAARVAALPATVIHGELYPANVLIAPGARVCVVDWETISRGPALLDLATLTAGQWDEPGESLAEAYRAALPDPPPRTQLLTDLDACRLLVAAGRLAAPPDWRPPPAQARDWRADARLIAERIG